MLEKKNILWVLILLVSLCLPVACMGAQQVVVKDVEIVFYGKVVDQYYQPVAGAEVHADIFRSQADKNIKTPSTKVKTDKKGLFTIKGKGLSIFIAGIGVDGYEFLSHKNPDRSFEYSSAYRNASFVPDQTAPLIFRMQKIKGEPAYLIHQPALERNFLPTENRGYNLNLGGNWIDAKGQFQNNSGHVDLRIKCGLSKDKNKMELTITSMDSNSGVLSSKKLFQEAPLAGYAPEITIEVDIPERYQERKIYIYAKARGGMMYSRLDCQLSVRPSNLLISMDVWTNPEHSRNLKYDKAFQKYVKKERYDVRERYYQENIRAMKIKQQFKYEPRTLLSVSSEQVAAKNKQKRSGYYYNATKPGQTRQAEDN
jgi:hypothetical protein